MKENLMPKIYIALVVVMLGAFAFASANHYRLLSIGNSGKYHHEYQPGIHMLRHK